MGYDVHDYLSWDKYVYFERELWFDLGECIQRKHWSVYKNHMKYVRNNIVKPFKLKILPYAKRVCKMNNLDNYLPSPLMKSDSAEAANWNVRNQEFTAS